MTDQDPIQSDLYLNRFSFRYLRKEDIQDAMEHAKAHLFSSWVPLGYDDSMQADWARVLIEKLESSVGTSFQVVDIQTGKIVGLRVINIISRDAVEKKHEFEFIQFKNIYDYTMRMATKCDIFKKYPNIDEFADLFGMSVNPEYRNQGITTETYRRTLIMLQKRGFKVVRCGFISRFSRRAAYKFGCFQIVKEMCIEARASDGTLINPEADPEDYKEYCIFEI